MEIVGVMFSPSNENQNDSFVESYRKTCSRDIVIIVVYIIKVLYGVLCTIYSF